MLSPSHCIAQREGDQAYTKEDEEMFDLLFEKGAVTSADPNELQELHSLCEEGIALLCSEIAHHPDMINPSYTFVINDEEGKKLALTPLFTRKLN